MDDNERKGKNIFFDEMARILEEIRNDDNVQEFAMVAISYPTSPMKSADGENVIVDAAVRFYHNMVTDTIAASKLRSMFGAIEQVSDNTVHKYDA